MQPKREMNYTEDDISAMFAARVGAVWGEIAAVNVMANYLLTSAAVKFSVLA
jgi:uncharacterized membrane protein